MEVLLYVEKTEHKPAVVGWCQVGQWRQLRPSKKNVIIGHVTSINDQKRAL